MRIITENVESRDHIKIHAILIIEGKILVEAMSLNLIISLYKELSILKIGYHLRTLVKHGIVNFPP